MPFPEGMERPKRVPSGRLKTRKYAVWFCNRLKDSADESNWIVKEVAGSSIAGVHNKLVRILKENKPDVKKSDVLLMECHILPPRTTLEQYLAQSEEE